MEVTACDSRLAFVMLLYILTCVCDNSKMLSHISFKLGTHMYFDQ